MRSSSGLSLSHRWIGLLIALSAACSDARAGGGDTSDAGVDSSDEGADVVTPADRSVTPDTTEPADVPVSTDAPVTPDVPVSVDVPVTPDVPISTDVPGVPCPSSIAGNGQPCSLVGDGCGGGAGPCSDSYACTCNSAHRWQCITMSATCDGGVDAPSTDVPATDVPTPIDAPSSCSLAGSYTLTLAAIGSAQVDLNADGTWSYSSFGSTLGSGTYTTSPSQLSVRETSGSLTGCTPTQTGTYGYSFSADCRTLRTTLIDDPCSLRASAFNGAMLTRR